jgi:hypothetical protein
MFHFCTFAPAILPPFDDRLRRPTQWEVVQVESGYQLAPHLTGVGAIFTKVRRCFRGGVA